MRRGPFRLPGGVIEPPFFNRLGCLREVLSRILTGCLGESDREGEPAKTLDSNSAPVNNDLTKICFVCTAGKRPRGPILALSRHGLATR